MTVSSETAKSGPYTGNGATTVFAYGFRILDASHIEVIRTVAGTGSTVSPSEYTVSGVGDLAGGNVTFAVAPASGQTITIVRNAPFTQQTDLENQGAYYAETIEEALDLAAMRDQQMAEELTRAVKLPVGYDPSQLAALTEDLIRVADSADEIDTVAGIEAEVVTVAGLTTEIAALPGQLSSAQDAADAAVAALDSFDDRYLGAKAVAPTVDNDGNAMLVGAVYWDTVSNQMFTWSGAEWRPTFLTGNAVRALVTATGGQTVVTVPTYLVGANTIQVYLNGLKVMVGADYTETDQNTITFLSALTAGDEVEVIVLQPYAIGTTGAESITTEYGVTLARLLELRNGTVADLLSDTSLNSAVLTPGQVVEAGGYRFRVSSGAQGEYVTAGGVQLDRIPPEPVPGGRAKLALIFDDGYKNNVTGALPILRKYGFAATIAVEIERINLNYNGNANLPVVTAEDMREWIRAGGEICNHPALDKAETEANMAAEAVAENERLRDILSGALVWNGSTFVSGAVTHPEFSNFRVDSAVYRGGGRNATSDLAYFTVFDKVRTINGPVASRGDAIYVTDPQGEMPMLWSAYTIDTNDDASAFAGMLAWVRSLAGSQATGIIYAHFTPDVTPTFAAPPPYITTPQLDELCRLCYENGIEIVPFNRIGASNLVPQNALADENGMILSQGVSGNTATFDTAVKLNSLPRSINLTAATAATGGNRPRMTTGSFVVAPFSRYRVRVRYKIDTELNRGGVNPNHGMEVSLGTTSADTPGSSDFSLTNYQATQPAAIPFEVTSGWATHETTLISGLGFLAKLSIALNQCTGTVWVGHISIEKLDSLSRRPLVLVNTYNTSIARRISWSAPSNAGSRKWRWKVDVESSPVVSATTSVNYAFNDSADVPAPSAGQTVYVLGRGVGAFATRGGQIGTWDGAAWGSWTTPAYNTLIRATTSGEGFANAHYYHHRRNVTTGGQFTRLYNRAFVDQPFVQRISGGTFDVWNSSGTRTDEFRLVLTPIIE